MFPVDKFSKVTIEQLVDIRISDTRYYRNRARGNKSPLFMISLTSSPLPYEEHTEVSAQIEAYEGELEIFQITNPLPALAVFTNKNVNATFSRGTKTIVITGNHAFRVGDFVQFNNHLKVYRISEVISGANTTISLSCPLIETIINTTQLIYGANVIFQVCLSDNYSQEVSIRNSKFGVVDVELIEQA